eukprot:13405727-Alexandrium_andersonii.AAC.1
MMLWRMQLSHTCTVRVCNITCHVAARTDTPGHAHQARTAVQLCRHSGEGGADQPLCGHGSVGYSPDCI